MTRHKTSNNNPNNTNHQTNNNNQSTVIYDIKSNNKQQDNECLKMKKKTKLDKLSADCSTKTTLTPDSNPALSLPLLHFPQFQRRRRRRRHRSGFRRSYFVGHWSICCFQHSVQTKYCCCFRGCCLHWPFGEGKH